jgi:hypothetical protein
MFRAFVNRLGTVSVESTATDYKPQPGEVLFADPPTDGELDARFPDAVLAAARAKARAFVSAKAEEVRLQFVTPGSGKAMAYQEKAQEAAKYLAAADPNPADFPLLGSEVGITAPKEAGLAGVATAVVGKYQLFRQLEAQIGGMEAAAQKAIKDADDVGTIEAVVAGLTWPAPGGA